MWFTEVEIKVSPSGLVIDRLQESSGVYSVCVYVRVCVRWCVRTLVCTYVGVYVRWCVRTLVCTYVGVYVRWCVRCCRCCVRRRGMSGLASSLGPEWFSEDPSGKVVAGQSFSLKSKRVLYHQRSKYQDILVFER